MKFSGEFEGDALVVERQLNAEGFVVARETYDTFKHDRGPGSPPLPVLATYSHRTVTP